MQTSDSKACEFVRADGVATCRVCGRVCPDTGRPLYAVCGTYRKPAEAPAAGPGTELKKLLAVVGIKATANCSCNTKARIMNDRGPDWCEANIDTIVGWLREEAGKRGLPFLDAAGRMLIRRAIANARKAAS